MHFTMPNVEMHGRVAELSGKYDMLLGIDKKRTCDHEMHGKAEGKRSQGRPVRQWLDDVKE